MTDAGAVGGAIGAPSHATLAAALSHLPDAVLVVDADCNVRWANPASGRLFGFEVNDWVGKSGLALVHPDDLEMAAVSLASVLDKEVGTPVELRLQTSRGWRLFEVVGAPVPTEAGRDVVLSLRDLTARRRWEVARDEVARFRSLVHNAAPVTLLVLPNGMVDSASGALTRLLGHDPERVAGRPFLDLIAAADRDLVASALHESAASPPGLERAVVVDARLRNGRADGPDIPFELTIINLVDDPTVAGFVVSGHDITDRLLKDAELNAALSLLGATLDATADGVLVVDFDGRISRFNRKFAEMWRLPREILDGGDDSAALSFVLEQLVDSGAFVAKVRELYAHPEAESFDTLHFKDGRVFERYSTPQRVDGEIVGRVWSFRDVTETKRLEKQLAHQAFHDALTNLPNQTLFRDRVNHALERAQRSTSPVAVLFIDLDNFKTVNDSLGHPAGDQLITSVTDRLQGCLRAGDTAARLGGDEFAVLLEDIDGVTDAVEVAERVIGALRRPFRIAGNDVFTSCSIGIALGRGPVDCDQLLRNADLAMYTAKGSGKCRYDVFEPRMHAAAVQRLALDADLRRALAGDEFAIYYQPIVNLLSGAVVALEALARWRHPTRGLLNPRDFIPVAEDTGLIEEIGMRVLDTGCAQLAEWQQAFPEHRALSMAVNLSPREIGETLRTRVATALTTSRVDPTTLVLEITEGAMMRDADATVLHLGALKELGVRLAVDDFGTGYSSLTYLERFPVDILKIDRYFVSGTSQPEDRGLVAAIVRLADTMRLVAVAEGVETSAQATAVRAAGCQLAQGYYYAPPIPADDVTTLLASSPPVRAA